MQLACNKMQVGRVADTGLRHVRNEAPSVGMRQSLCLHHPAQAAQLDDVGLYDPPARRVPSPTA